MAVRRKVLRVVCIQLSAVRDWKANLAALRKKLVQALRFRPDLVALPENFVSRGPAEDLRPLAFEVTPRVIRELQDWARAAHTAVLLGSVVEPSPVKNKYFNTSILISETGRVAARYRKIHLFDVNLPRVRTQESRHVTPGRKCVTGKACGIRMGLAICYDLRFPELFRELTRLGSRILFVPSNFTETTGKAHWEILLRARAVENQAFVVAPAQVGAHPAAGIRSFGRSVIVDPWGKVLARASRTREEIIAADLDLLWQKRLRRSFPVLRHSKWKSIDRPGASS